MRRLLAIGLAPLTSLWTNASRCFGTELALSISAFIGFTLLCSILLLTPVAQTLRDALPAVPSEPSQASATDRHSAHQDLRRSFGLFTMPKTKASLSGASGHVILQVTLQYNRYELWELSGRTVEDPMDERSFLRSREILMTNSIIDGIGFFTVAELSKPSGLEQLKTDLREGINHLFAHEEFVDSVLIKNFLLFPLGNSLYRQLIRYPGGAGDISSGALWASLNPRLPLPLFAPS